MPTSYEERLKELAEQDDSNPEPEDEIAPSVETKTVEELRNEVESTVEAVPDFLKPSTDTADTDRPDLGGRRDGIQFDFDLDNLGSLTDANLLEVIARVEIVQLEVLLDIADSVDSFDTITVSGTNAIDNANESEVVVPESDNEVIPTRQLMIRSDTDNTNKIYFGDDEVRPNSGFVLLPGEMIVVEVDLRGEELHMASGEAGEQVQLLGVI